MNEHERPYAVFIIGDEQFTIFHDLKSGAIRHERTMAPRRHDDPSYRVKLEDSQRAKLVVSGDVVVKDMTGQRGKVRGA